MTILAPGDNVYLKTDAGDIFLQIVCREHKTHFFVVRSITDVESIDRIKQGKIKALYVDLRDPF